MATSLLVLISVALSVSSGVCASKDASEGFGTALDWKSPAMLEGFDWASNTKPIMYLFNQPWCGACNALKADFQENSKDIKELSESFVLVNVAGDDNNSFKEEYQPDGGYIPRILFADPQNKLKPELSNPGRSDQYKYYYTSVEDVGVGMKAALSSLGGASAAHTEL